MLRVLILIAVALHTAVVGNFIYLYIPTMQAPHWVAIVGWSVVGMLCVAWVAPFIPWLIAKVSAPKAADALFAPSRRQHAAIALHCPDTSTVH